MRQRLFLPIVFVCVFLTAAASGQNVFKINEAQIEAFFADNRLEMNIVLENSPHDFQAKIKLEILDADDRIIANNESLQTVKRGRQTFPTTLNFAGAQDEESLLWHRLKYAIAPADGSDKNEISGVVSLSEIMPEIFELRASAAENIFAGMNYRVRVRAFHPATNQPTANVKIGGQLKLDLDTDDDDDDTLKINAAGKTDRDGYARLDFKIPAGAQLDDDGEIKITGEKNGVRREAEEDLNPLEASNQIYLFADKPIYQPAQQFRARGLLMSESVGAATRATVAERELEFTIEDEDDTILFRETAKTSRFGVAALAWTIPEDAKLGTYQIRVKDKADDEQVGSIEFKVSRYDLPNFTVTAKPDKTFYLPEDRQAEIIISADYLFGKAVETGAVKVVRETERRWNYKRQKYETDEETPIAGETNEGGKFVARVDLQAAHENLKDETYRRFEDLHFAAYFTDSTTNRTEQRRFDVRVSKDAIHVYAVALENGKRNPKMPVSFYVSTFYADGAPAACAVEITGKYADEPDAQTKVLAKLKTNSLGAGLAEFQAPTRADENYRKDLQIKIIAADAQNRTGAHEEEIDIDVKAKNIRVHAGKAVYRTGEAITARVVSTETDAEVFVDVVKDWSVVASVLVRLKNGRADVKIPFNKNFTGEITIAAYIDGEDEDGDEDLIDDATGIIYPHPNDLRLDVRQTKTVYRPNEEARIDFAVKSPDERGSETALGVVIFDRAIEERARTDAEFGGGRRANQFGDLPRLLDSELNRIDTSKPVSDDLQTRSALMLADAHYSPSFFDSAVYKADLKRRFGNYFVKQFAFIEIALKNEYAKDYAHPTDTKSLLEILRENQIDFANLKDPWAMPYQAEIKIEDDENVVYIRSAGANKTVGDKDDFVILKLKFKYFTPTGKAIDAAVRDFQARTGSFVRDYATLRDELKKQNVDLDNLKDRFNRPYQIKFDVSQRFFTIEFKSSGADGSEDDSYRGDDFSVWTTRTDYFADRENKIQTALQNYASAKKTFPKNENEFKEILKNGDIDFDALRDGWNQPLGLTFTIFSRYADRVKTEVVGKYGDNKASEKLIITPVTQQIAAFKLRSAGADGKAETYDDFDLATVSGVVAEQTKDDAKPVELKTETVFTGGRGAVRGVAKDPMGAAIPGAKISATNEETSAVFEAETDDNGVYWLKNLPSGKYTIRAESAGFQIYVIQNVPVRSSTVSELNFQMNVGGVSQTVDVTTGGAEMQTTNATMSATSVENVGTVNILQENSTPRLREYFPETLLWQPELITDKNGKAELKFKLADNLTTWKLYAIGSNAQGKVGVAEREIKTFQPFFVDLEPPKNLTVGDRIGLPVQIRNYTPKAQTISVSMAAGVWFSALNAAKQTIEVAPDKSANAIFDFRADTAIKSGKQRVTATADADSDAIEKTVRVRPNGKEIVKTSSQIFRESAAFDVNFPANPLPKTKAARLKIYPNLLAHVAESVEGLLARPYGCGEQTISSTYPNLMILKVAENSKDALSPQLQAQAQKFLRQGYERLLGYQTASGGFSFWGASDTPEAALTAYAIRFLTDAEDFIDVDETVIERAEKWLLSQQRADGSWTKQYSWEKTEDKARTKITTTYIARVLAMISKGDKTIHEKFKNEKLTDAQTALKKAFDYLKARNAEIDEPFALASFALALFDAGDAAAARAVVEKLETMAIAENGGVAYWNLETNTPFYGWGTAGRIETTALVVQAIVKAESGRMKAESGRMKDETNPKSKIENPKSADLISKGTLFLLKNKDRYGVWHSTQASVNVLDALLAVVGDGNAKSENQPNRAAEIFVNNQKVKDVVLPAANLLAVPLDVDLSGALSANDNRVEIKINGNSNAATAQIVANHYVSWRDFTADGRDVNQSRQLRLEYDCDKKDAAIMQEINCAVEAERIGFRGYGMLLAEIGLPPGADVNRASLEKSKAANWNFSRYEVLPDRIIVYLWAQAGGTRINFKFKSRYAVQAQSAPSIVYDYYNAEAQATVAPLKFAVK